MVLEAVQRRRSLNRPKPDRHVASADPGSVSNIKSKCGSRDPLMAENNVARVKC